MTKNSRKLTDKEIKRGEQYQKIRNKLLEEGYEETDLTIGVVKANIMVLVTSVPIVLLFLIIFIMLNLDATIKASPVLFLVYLVGIVVHELIHGITWATFCKTKWKAISFGVIWKYITPYCSCNEPLTYKAYITGGLMPTIILGLIPYIISLITGNPGIMLFSLFLILGGGGDIYIASLLRKHKNALFIDHPYEVGCTAFEKPKTELV